MPSTSRSVLATERPRVLRPGKSIAVSRDTAEPKKLSVSPASLRFVDLKSAVVMVDGLLHSRPLMKAGCGLFVRSFFSSQPFPAALQKPDPVQRKTRKTTMVMKCIRNVKNRSHTL